jgi:hypothetical protein
MKNVYRMRLAFGEKERERDGMKGVHGYENV